MIEKIKDKYLFANSDGTIDFILITNDKEIFVCKNVLIPLPEGLRLTTGQLINSLVTEFLKRYKPKPDNDFENIINETNRRLNG